MNRLHYLAAIAATAITALCSCESPARLASHLEGEWSGAPERLTDTNLSYVSMTPSLEFTRQQGPGADRTAGEVTLTAQVDTQLPADGFPADSLGETPVSFSVAAVVTAKGTWKAIDDDDVAIHFNAATVLSSVDSKAVCEYASPMSATDRAATTELPDAVIRAIDRSLTTTIKDYVAGVRELDDVEIKGTFMKCKIGGSRQTFTRLY